MNNNKGRVGGLEPPTCWLRMNSCSTNWATQPIFKNARLASGVNLAFLSLQRPRWALSTAKPTNEHFPLQSISVCKHVKEHFGFGVLPSLPGNAYNLTAVMFPAPFIVNPYFYRFLLSKNQGTSQLPGWSWKFTWKNVLFNKAAALMLFIKIVQF